MTLGLVYDTATQRTAPDRPATLNRDAYAVNMSVVRGTWAYQAQVLKAETYEGSLDTGAYMFTVGILKTFGEWLEGSIGYTEPRNEANAAFQAIDGSRGDLGTLPGGSPRAFGVGVRYSF